MEVGVVKIADDSDFRRLKTLIDDNTNWKLDFFKGEDTKVWTQSLQGCDFKMVKIYTIFRNVTPETLFDVLHDPQYRTHWDIHMIESTEIGYLNPNNDVGYYSMTCPAPLKNRDFVLQRSWLDLGNEKLIVNHSIPHKNYPPKKGFVRAVSYLTGFVIRERPDGCFMGYVSHTDPRGKLQPWLVNKTTQIFAPKMVKQLRKAAEGYESWKSQQKHPDLKPWIYPEQTLRSPRVKIEDCRECLKASNSSHNKDTD
ncbi:hypothetical protein RN001_012156 [Aquatica leii]|uniref:START domain-containing protein 10 n=1 Tax=Aquatica leii TaxID=1421715 RepID=A0AAN7PSL1_9COLE|nr:hypothetical protein RN001_012156 [Aquatica leii]